MKNNADTTKEAAPMELTAEQIARLPIASRIRYRQATIILHVMASNAGPLYIARTMTDCPTVSRTLHPIPDDAVEEAAQAVNALRD
jgi:hypothetical protein